MQITADPSSGFLVFTVRFQTSMLLMQLPLIDQRRLHPPTWQQAAMAASMLISTAANKSLQNKLHN